MAVSESERRVVLDTTSLVCPYPYLRAKKVLAELAAGEELELITDNEATVRSSVPALARQFRVEADVREEEPGCWRVVFRRG